MFELPKEIIEGINIYKKELRDYLDGKTDDARFIGMRIPWGIYSHRGKQFYMARIRIPGGFVSSVQLKAIALASKKYGNGICHITTRQDIQIHGLKIDYTGDMIEDLARFNLSPRGGGGNTVRNITACPLSGICNREILNVSDIPAELSEYLLQQENSYNLPRKFKIAFSGCQQDCSRCLVNDIGFLSDNNNGQHGFKVFTGGGTGVKPALGYLLESFISVDDMPYCVCAIKNVYYKNGNRKNKHHNRLKFLIQDIGFEKFRQLYLEELAELKKQEFIVLKKTPEKLYEKNHGEIPQVDDPQYKEFLKYNIQPQKQDGYSIIKLRIPRGDILADNILKISELEKELPGIEFKTSFEQNLYLTWVKNQDVYKLYLKINEFLKDFLYPDTLLDISVCKGALTCNLGLCNSPGLSEAVESMIKKEFIGKPILKKLDIHINGCPNSCGHAPLSIFGFSGLTRMVSNRPVPFYKILLGGRISGESTKFAEEIGIIPGRNIPVFLQRFLNIIEKEIKENNIYAFMETRGREIIKEILPDFSFVPSYSENKSFYIDWGKTEEFSLKDLGQGECGAGVLDIIKADITHSKILLSQAEKENYPAEEIKKSIFFSARALLILKGKDPMVEQEALEEFYEIFVKTGIASETYSSIKEVFSEISDIMNDEQRKEKFIYAQNFVKHIESLYNSMDSSFNFPKEKKYDKQGISEHLLDLKGIPCPINYVKANLFLENITPGEIVDILLDEGEPINNVPKSLSNDGHKILNIEKEKDGIYRVRIQKKGGQ